MHKIHISKIINKFRDLFTSGGACISTIFMRVYCFASGIYLGENTIFFGCATISKATQSNITIGSKCCFRSKTISNLIGINHRCIIATHAKTAHIEIGDNCGFSGTTIGAFCSIKLGNNVRCGANTLITDSDWHPNDSRVGNAKPIVIANNVWLGYGVIIMKGVTIGENTVIGAGSIVTRNIPSNVIAAGNPCKVIKTI